MVVAIEECIYEYIEHIVIYKSRVINQTIQSE